MRSKRADTNITPEAIEAFRRGRGSDLHVALGLAPWEISPLEVHRYREPTPEYLERGRDKIYMSSWHQARDLRDALEKAIARKDR
jgi:hypothetical protein